METIVLVDGDIFYVSKTRLRYQFLLMYILKNTKHFEKKKRRY